jgi:hypothetical protein
MLGFFEQLGITIFVALLHQLHFDPAKHAGLGKVLIPIRDTLNTLYPPTPVQ